MTTDEALFMCILSFSSILSMPAPTAFTEVPSSQVVFVGQQAVFRCHHSTARFIDWNINGSLLTFPVPPPGIFPSTTRDGDGTVVNILTISAHSEYNGSEVQCVAIFRDGSPNQFSPTVMLKVLTTSTSSHVEFEVVPIGLIVAQDQEASFHCQHSTAYAIVWKMNGTIYHNSVLHWVSVSSNTSGGVSSTFTIMAALSEYNNTKIQCLTTLSNGSLLQESDSVVLVIQGPLHSVSNLKRTSSMITWTPPFSLNLSSIDPDIVYCVNLYNISCGERTQVLSDCDVTEPQYVNDLIHPECIYEVSVTPRSNVNGSVDGLSLQLREEYIYWEILESVCCVIRYHLGNIAVVDIHLSSDSANDGVVPAYYFLMLSATDGMEGDIEWMLLEPTVVIAGRPGMPSLKATVRLQFRRLWTCTVLAYNCTTISEPFQISTHDIQNVSVLSENPGEVRVTGDYLDGSPATGIFAIIYSLDMEFDVSYKIATASERNIGDTRKIDAKFAALEEGHYNISIFILDDVGIPHTRIITTPKHIVVLGNVTAPANRTCAPVEYEIESNSSHVCIICIFKSLDRSTTGCLAVVHQRISQLGSNGLTTIAVHKINRHNDIESHCIKGLDLNYYQIGVVKLMKATVGTDGAGRRVLVCGVGCVAGSVLAAVIAIGMLVLLLILYCAIKIKKVKTENMDDQIDMNVVMKTNIVYEITHPHQSVNMEQNPAYEETKLQINMPDT